MQIGRIDGCTRVLGKSQGYLGLPLRDVLINCSVGGPDTPAMETAWFPTPDEMTAINAGAPVILRVLGTQHPPVMLYAGSAPADPSGCDSSEPIEARPFQVPDTLAVADALSLMLWHSGSIATAFRAAGTDIKTRAEDEQAFVLRWALNLALRHGDNWRNAAGTELTALGEKITADRPEGDSSNG